MEEGCGEMQDKGIFPGKQQNAWIVERRIPNTRGGEGEGGFGSSPVCPVRKFIAGREAILHILTRGWRREGAEPPPGPTPKGDSLSKRFPCAAGSLPCMAPSYGPSFRSPAAEPVAPAGETG
jgi:hypothetical protein